MLLVMRTPGPSEVSQVFSRISLCSRRATMVAFSLDVRGSRMTNSSPP